MSLNATASGPPPLVAITATGSSGTVPATGLSLRLDNGQFLPVDGSVSAVPEAPT